MGTSTRRGRRIIAAASVLTVASPLAMTAMAAEPKLDQAPQTYIVQLQDAPVAAYTGGTAGLAATSPAPGEKVDADSPEARKYADHLRREQRNALRRAGLTDAAKKHEYTVAFNGFAARMTPAQADQVRKASGVLNVWADEIRHADTVTTPQYLGMSGPNGVWSRQFGGDANAGKGMVVGVIDTGIDPNNPSFAPLAGAAAPGGFTCDKGDDPAFACSSKIVGARYYGAAFGNNVSYDHNSPRDTNGHGSHTAGTAAGNNGVDISVLGNQLGKGSGMAPAAHVAVYKALWQTADGQGSGTTSGLVQAINDAVADGVDVINYSVSGSSTFVVTADELAFFTAAQAGIFVSTSAGNSGDTVGVSSVAHNSPWTMTVAASSHNRGASKKVTLGNGAVYDGLGVGDAVGPAPLVLAANIALPGVSAQAARECWPDANNNTADGRQPALDPAKAAGRIVICDRGTVARVDKSEAVKIAGGIGMIQTNTSDAQSLNADFHHVPSIHVNATNGAAIKAYAATPNPTATISAVSNAPVDAPSMAGFSSYGPALAGTGDLLKPDITAPGVDVLAAYAEDPVTKKPRFDSLSGTSMSAPHIAGLGALLKQKFPTWSPMAIKSAMMTTARQTTNDGKPIQWAEGNATPLNFGAGEVVPTRSYTPGLVYDSGVTDWLRYACGINQMQLVQRENCKGDAMDPSDLNYPSIAVGDLAGKQTITRTVTNVEQRATQYKANVEAPAGTKVTVSPSTLTIPPRQSRTFTVTIERTSAPLGKYSFGALTWEGNRGQKVRSPLAVRPVALAAPAEVTGTGASGSVTIPVTPGFTGTLGVDVDGLQPSAVTRQAVTRRDGTTLDGYFFFDVAAGTKVTRVATWSSEVAAGDIDLNLYRYNANGTITQVGSSGNGDSTEEITLRLEPGRYVAAVDLFSNEPSVTAPVHVWNITDAAAGNLTVTPNPVQVTSGTRATLTATWQGLDASRRWLGQVNLLNGTDPAGSTLVSVNP